MALHLVLILLMLCRVDIVKADIHTEKYDFNISEETLGAALTAFTLQAGVQLLYPYELASTKGIKPVSGRYTLQEALDIMLRDTLFSGGLTERGIVTITRLEQKQKQAREDSVSTSKTKRSLLAGISALVFGASGATTVQAQNSDSDSLEEIVVTATKRASSIQDVAFSINAQSQLDIQRSGANNLEDLSRNVAGLTIQNLGPGQSQVSIRGVSAGQIVRDQPGVKEQVGVYLDESVISLSLFTPDLDLFDLNRVETLRGPQGTLFGSGSIGGTIRYITNAPNFEGFEGSVQGELNAIDGGSVGGNVKAAANFVLAEDVAALRVVAYHTEYGGFIDAIREGGSIDENVNTGTRTGGRIALAFKPSESLTITPRLIYQEIETDGFNRQEIFNVFANPFTTTRPAVTFEERQQFLQLREGFEDETLIADLTIESSFDGFDLTAVSSYTDREILVSRDASALTGSVSIDLGYPDSAVLIPSNLRDVTEVEQFTQEVRFSSNGDGPFQWLVGGFYSDTDRFYQQTLPTPGYDAVTDAVLGAGTSEAVALGVGPTDSPFFSELPYSLEQYAAFAELTYDLTDRLQITAGGRYYDYSETRSVTQVGLFGNGVVNQVDETASDGFTPRILARYDVSEEVSINAQVSKGFRLGGVNDPLNTALCNANDLAIFGGFQDYDDETLVNYEAGIKVNTGKVQFNAAAFYTDISDLQVTLDAGSCSSRISFNVPEAHTLGVEFELKAKPTKGLDLSIAGSVIEAEFDTTVLDSTGAVLGGVEDGNRLPTVPQFQIAATGSYSFPVEFIGNGVEAYIAGNIQHVGSRFTQPSDQTAGAGDFVSGLAFGGAPGTDVTSADLELDAYQTLNLSAGIYRDNWEVVAYVNNVTDENANLSFDRERGGRARLGFRTNQPRTFGLILRTNF
ncbi:TonB-dependent receptor [Kordiimonas aquimaris]|uniref:TonB-dependent receptor n=1 Tax=Kordiimonas aquimaris TaxID=707591 RepID=UPI0021CE2CCB|nr:TonB-dependent receptor [Kordiimonas aquimaris]